MTLRLAVRAEDASAEVAATPLKLPPGRYRLQTCLVLLPAGQAPWSLPGGGGWWRAQHGIRDAQAAALAVDEPGRLSRSRPAADLAVRPAACPGVPIYGATLPQMA